MYILILIYSINNPFIVNSTYIGSAINVCLKIELHNFASVLYIKYIIFP